MKRWIAVLGVWLVAACSGGAGVMDGVMASWMGAPLDEVIDRWGYPDRERQVAGRKLFEWDRNVSVFVPSTTTGTVSNYGNTSYVDASTTGGGLLNGSCRRTIEVDSRNIVVGTQWAGNNCPFAEAGPYSNWRR